MQFSSAYRSAMAFIEFRRENRVSKSTTRLLVKSGSAATDNFPTIKSASIDYFPQHFLAQIHWKSRDLLGCTALATLRSMRWETTSNF